jgi:antitoxin (DNA-binding transcriptional repressor) of toxin-antitoxin stability system
MSGKTVNIHDAKAQPSPLIAPVGLGERNVIARAGKPVTEQRPAGTVKNRSKPLGDPLLRVDEYSYNGQIVPMTNENIDRTVYGT